MTVLVRTMACMTIATAQPDTLGTLLEAGLGWERCAHGPIGEDLTAAWGIAAGSAGTDFALFRSPGADRGMIRVIAGQDRYPARPIGARWSGVEIVVMEDIDGLFARLAADPAFIVGKAPENADFTDVGANVHRFFFGRAPGGTHLMFTAAVTQARDYAFPTADAPVGHIFSIPLVTTDYRRSLDFYRGALGMIPTLEDRLEDGLWHATWAIPPGTPVDLSILKGDAPGFGLGGIELQGYPDTVVDPVPARLDALDGGACLGTFTTTDFEAALAVVARDPAVLAVGEVRSIDAPPYRGARTVAIVGPGGERLELAEAFLP